MKTIVFALAAVTLTSMAAQAQTTGVALCDDFLAKYETCVGTKVPAAQQATFKTQLDQLEGMVRTITDVLWTGSRRVRAWRGGDVRAVYYAVLAALVLWGVLALRLAQPIVLLQVGANVAGAVFVVAAPHLLWVNTCLLPPELRPPTWRRAALVLMALFYATFTALSVASLL